MSIPQERPEWRPLLPHAGAGDVSGPRDVGDGPGARAEAWGIGSVGGGAVGWRKF